MPKNKGSFTTSIKNWAHTVVLKQRKSYGSENSKQNLSQAEQLGKHLSRWTLLKMLAQKCIKNKFHTINVVLVTAIRLHAIPEMHILIFFSV